MADGIREMWPTAHITECFSWWLECRLTVGSKHRTL